MDALQIHPKVSVPLVAGMILAAACQHFGWTISPTEWSLIAAAFGYATPDAK